LVKPQVTTFFYKKFLKEELLKAADISLTTRKMKINMTAMIISFNLKKKVNNRQSSSFSNLIKTIGLQLHYFKIALSWNNSNTSIGLIKTS